MTFFFLIIILNFYETTSPLKLLRVRAKFVILFCCLYLLQPSSKLKKKKGKAYQKYSLTIQEHKQQDP